MALRVLISAGEASGDIYGAAIASALRARYPEAEFFGCAGPRMRDAGVEPVIRSESLSVVGLVEVIRHIPRIYGEFRKLIAGSRARKPDFAILTDAPDFHLRVAKKLKSDGVPVFYVVAPQVWAWRQGRVKLLREVLRHLYCIFPFEEEFFRQHGVAATYVGHPLAQLIRPSMTKAEFFRKHAIPTDRPLIAVLPGSRSGEVGRHLRPLAEAVDALSVDRKLTFLAGTPRGFHGGSTFWERFSRSSIQVVEGETWDLLAHADLAMAASGTVTIEAALLGTPMVTFYRVSPLSWALGRRLVKVPFLSMANLVAQRAVVPELIQQDMTAAKLAAEVRRLLDDPSARATMVAGLNEVRERLMPARDPMEAITESIGKILSLGNSKKEVANVR